jgi:hypothetical protein
MTVEDPIEYLHQDDRSIINQREVEVDTPFVRDCIVDPERTYVSQDAIAAGTSQYGMQTFDQSLYGLYQGGRISYDTALRWASNPDEFKMRVQGVTSTAAERATRWPTPGRTTSVSRPPSPASVTDETPRGDRDRRGRMAAPASGSGQPTINRAHITDAHHHVSRIPETYTCGDPAPSSEHLPGCTPAARPPGVVDGPAT